MTAPNRSRKGAARRQAVLLAAVAAVAAGLLVPGGSALTQAAPVNTGEPRISGNAVVGRRLTTSRGSWSGNPNNYAYQWVRCPTSGGRPDGADCAAIGGATTSAYVLANGDVGSRLRARVTASNRDGATTVASNATEVVRAAVSPSAEHVSADDLRHAGVNETLRATPATWTGTQPITFSFQWLRCDRGGGNCLTLPGFTDDAYTAPRRGYRPHAPSTRERVELAGADSALSPAPASCRGSRCRPAPYACQTARSRSR